MRSTLLIPCLVTLICGTMAAPAVCQSVTTPGTGPTITVAVASNAVPVIKELAESFSKETSIPVTISSGSTGLLARQIEEGGPYDLFISADMRRIDQLVRRGKLESDGAKAYTRGVLVLWVPEKAITKVKTLEELGTVPNVRLALANALHAPYGAAARASLGKLGLWEAVKGKCIYAEDVGQTLQVAQSGNADAAVVPKSLVQGRKDGTMIEVPLDSYPPHLQGVGVVGESVLAPQARQFRDYLLSEKGQAVFLKNGYLAPVEENIPQPTIKQ